jgi:uncharacterized integral membrane protein
MADDSPPPGPDSLRSLLDAQLRELVETACANGGQVPSEASANAERLARLVQMQRDLSPPAPTGQRWRMVALFAGTLALLSLLLLATVRETEVELNLVVSELRFTLAARQQLSEPLQLASLGAWGLVNAALPGAPTGASGAAQVLLQAASTPSGGTISLAPLVGAAGAEVTLRTTDAPNELRLSVKGLDASVRADVSGTITALLPHRPKQTIDAATPQAVALVPGPADVDLDLVPLNPGVSPLAPSLAISTLALVRIDEVSQGGRSVVRRVSTLHSGSVFFNELSGRELRLRAREALRFGAARGEIRAVRFTDGRLIVDFHGRVRGMASGSLDHPRDLMPSWLEWLRANQPLALLWGAALSLFGLLTTLWQWWKKNA